jgi:hypothetical protein
MKDYATKSGGGGAQPAEPAQPQMGRMDRLGTGMVDALVGTMQDLAHMPDPMGFVPGPQHQVEEQGKQAIDKFAQDREGRIKAQSPEGTDWYRVGGNLASPAALVPGPFGKANIAGRVGNAAVQGAIGGMTQPATRPTDFAGQKVMQGAEGAAGGVAAYPIAAGLGKLGQGIYRWWKGIQPANTVEDKAVVQLLKRMEQDIKGGGPTTQDMLDVLNAARHTDKPITLADVGGENLQALIGRIQRSPGESRQLITKFLNDRDLEAGLRLDKDVSDAFGSGSAHDTMKALGEARSQAAKPLFEEAYQGGSIAPLEHQFSRAFKEAGAAEKVIQRDLQSARNRVTAAAARQNQAGDNVYAVSGANQDMRAAQAEVKALEAKLQQAQQAKQSILDVLRQAQEDATSHAPGAIWSPRIQEFLNNPRIQQGIKRGLRIERDNALAEGREMKPSEYSIVGTDAEGEPIVGKVPTMRLLAVAKEGLDRMLEESGFTNPETGQLNKEGIAIDKMRRSFLEELDKLNPKYKSAREAWSGPTQSRLALRQGVEFNKMTPEQLRDIVKDMNPNDLEFFRLGAAATLRKWVAETGAQGDEARKIAGNQYMRNKLRQFFPSDDAYNKFVDSVGLESVMFRTNRRLTGGSDTARRVTEDTTDMDPSSLAHGARTLFAVLNHHYGLAARDLTRLGQRWQDRKIANDPELNAAIARMAMDPSQAAGIVQRYPELARAMGAPWIDEAAMRLPGAAGAAAPNVVGQ